MCFINFLAQICLELECFKIVICLGNNVSFLHFEMQVPNYYLKLLKNNDCYCEKK